MATNPYSGLDKLATDQYNKTNTAIDNYNKSANQNIQDSLNQSIKELNQKKTAADSTAVLEGRAANADYLKSINPYGANADSMMNAGLGGSGYSETTKAANYNTMQNRISKAKTTADEAKLNYDNQIVQARNQSNAKLAELAYNNMTARANNLGNLLSNRINIAGGMSDRDIALQQLQLQRDEFEFSKKANASSSGGGGGRSYSRSGSSSSSSSSSGGKVYVPKDDENTAGVAGPVYGIVKAIKK